MKAVLGRLWHSPTATTWGSLFVRLSAVLFVLPLVLVRFASADVVLWQMFSTLFVLALMLDFGLSPTFMRLVAFARGGASLAAMGRMQQASAEPPSHATADDPAALATVLSTLRWLYPRLAVAATAMLALVGTATLVRPISQVADMPAAWLAWAAVLATTGIAVWGGAYAAALQGMDQVAVMRRWEVAMGLGQVASSTAVLLLGGQLLALVLAYQAWAVLGAFRNRWLMARLFPQLLAHRPESHPEVMRVMWSPAWRSGLGVLMSYGVIQASGLVYAQIAPAAEVAAYLLALRLMMVLSQFCQAPFYSKLPRLVSLHAEGRRSEQLRLAQRGMRLAYWVFVAGALAVALAAQPLLQALGSRTLFVPPGVWALMALAFFAERFGAMHLQLYSLTNHIVWHIANGVTGVVMVLLAALAYPRMGAHAFPAAMLLAYAGFYCVYSVVHSRRAFNFSLARFESVTAAPPAAALCAGLLLAFFLPIHL